MVSLTKDTFDTDPISVAFVSEIKAMSLAGIFYFDVCMTKNKVL